MNRLSGRLVEHRCADLFAACAAGDLPRGVHECRRGRARARAGEQLDGRSEQSARHPAASTCDPDATRPDAPRILPSDRTLMPTNASRTSPSGSIRIPAHF